MSAGGREGTWPSGRRPTARHRIPSPFQVQRHLDAVGARFAPDPGDELLCGGGACRRDCLDLAVGVLDPQAGDHLCAFYRGAEARDRVLVPFIRAGLLAGDKCVCLVNTPGVGATAAGICTPELQGVVGDQLEVRSAMDAYVEQGRFSTDRMITFLDDKMSEVFRSGTFPSVRVVGDMSWASTARPASDELFGYECEVNRFAPRYPQMLLCLYDLDQFGANVAVEVMKTHPKMLVGGIVMGNPNFVAPGGVPPEHAAAADPGSSSLAGLLARRAHHLQEVEGNVEVDRLFLDEALQPALVGAMDDLQAAPTSGTGDGDQQLVRPERLHHVAVGAAGEGEVGDAAVVDARHHHHGQVLVIAAACSRPARARTPPA